MSRLLYNKKIPAILPLLVHAKFVSDFCEKTNFFNDFFINMYTNTEYKYFTIRPFLYRTNPRITLFYVTKEYILLLIKALDLSKAHDWGNIQ